MTLREIALVTARRPARMAYAIMRAALRDLGADVDTLAMAEARHSGAAGCQVGHVGQGEARATRRLA